MPAQGRRTRKIACMRETGKHDQIAVIDLTRTDRMVEGHRDACAEQVAVFIECVGMSLRL